MVETPGGQLDSSGSRPSRLGQDRCWATSGESPELQPRPGLPCSVARQVQGPDEPWKCQEARGMGMRLAGSLSPQGRQGLGRAFSSCSESSCQPGATGDGERANGETRGMAPRRAYSLATPRRGSRGRSWGPRDLAPAGRLANGPQQGSAAWLAPPRSHRAAGTPRLSAFGLRRYLPSPCTTLSSGRPGPPASRVCARCWGLPGGTAPLRISATPCGARGGAGRGGAQAGTHTQPRGPETVTAEGLNMHPRVG